MKKECMAFVCALLCMALEGCGREPETEAKYPVLKMMSMGSEPRQVEEIYRELDALTEAELGVDVRIAFYPWEDEAETVRKLVNTNSFDIYVFGTPFGSEELIRKGAYLDMRPYLESMPQLTDFYESQGVDLLGQKEVYSLPRIQNSTGYGFFYREDLRKAWGLEPVEDFASMERYLYRAKEEYSGNAPVNDKRFFDSLQNLTAGGKYYCLDYGMGIRWEDKELVCLLEMPEYREALETAVKWYRDGVISEDILYLQNNNTMVTLELMRQDKVAAEFCNHFSAICSNYVMPLCGANPEWELGWLDYELLNSTCYDSYFTGTGQMGLAVDSKCKRPELAMSFLEKAHTDSRYYNLLSYGAEGIHYELNEDGMVTYGGIPAENVFRGQIGLEQDALMLTPQYPGNWDSVYRSVREQAAAMRLSNGKNPVTAFGIDAAAYSEFGDAISAYSGSRVRQMLETGTMADIEAGMREFREELDAAGYDGFFQAVREEWERFRKEHEDF